MRFVLIILALLTTPAFAQGWERYDNARYGYSIDIPPEFAGNGESDNGDGQGFQNMASAQDLVVWGGTIMGDFEAEVAFRQFRQRLATVIQQAHGEVRAAGQRRTQRQA